MSTTATEDRTQVTAIAPASGMICPIWFVGRTGTPPSAQYHYYAQKCPPGQQGATYGMSSSTPLQTGCGSPSCIPGDIRQFRKGSDAGPIGGTQSHTLNHLFNSLLTAQQTPGAYLDPA